MSKKVDFRLFCRYALGVVFVVSALLKFISTDAFGTYIYGLGLFSFELSAIVARLVIGFEFTLGVLLITRFYARVVDVLAFLSLLFFSMFLVGLVVKGEDGNCYCFGNALEFSPLASLLKNILFFALLYVGAKTPAREWRFAKYFPPSLFLLSIALCFILKWPDAFSSNRTVNYDEKAFESYVEQTEFRTDWKSGAKMMAFVSTSCPHCKLLTRKIHTALSNNGLSDSSVIWVVYDPKGKYEELLSNGEFKAPGATFMDGRILNITDGILPLVLLLKDGVVVDKMSNRTFSEQRLVEFFELTLSENNDNPYSK